MCAKAMSRAKAASDKMTACGHICQGGAFIGRSPRPSRSKADARCAARRRKREVRRTTRKSRAYKRREVRRMASAIFRRKKDADL